MDDRVFYGAISTLKEVGLVTIADQVIADSVCEHFQQYYNTRLVRSTLPTGKALLSFPKGDRSKEA